MEGNKQLKGFTLIEILVVVGLIALLAALVIFALNPQKYYMDTRNATRSSDLQQLAGAISRYRAEDGKSIDDFGTIPACGTDTVEIGTDTGNLNLASTLVDTYVPSIPKDPQGGTDAATNYEVCKTTSGGFELSAPNAENGKTIVIKG